MSGSVGSNSARVMLMPPAPDPEVIGRVAGCVALRSLVLGAGFIINSEQDFRSSRSVVGVNGGTIGGCDSFFVVGDVAVS